MNNQDDINWENIYTGVKGSLIRLLMNLLHKKTHRLIAEKLAVTRDDSILDVGCGGGSLVAMIAKKSAGKTTGIDYSEAMVTAAKRKNADGINTGKITVIRASVSELPFENNSFSKVTAFETIHFWPSIPDDLIEIKRVLKPGGSLHIMNRVPNEKSKWYDFVKFKNPDECRAALGKAGYVDIVVDTKLKKDWLYVFAKKQYDYKY